MCISFSVSEESVIALFSFFSNINFASGLKKAILKNFAKLSKKTPVPESQTYNFIKNMTLAQVFSYEFCKIFLNTFFVEHHWATASVASVVFSYKFCGNF